MNNTPRTIPVMHSFKALWQWLMVKPGQTTPTLVHPASSTCARAPGAAGQVVFSTHSPSSHTVVASAQVQLGRPLRVLQVMDAGASPAWSGRLRISGRMADVCAELDRLAAREAPQH